MKKLIKSALYKIVRLWPRYRIPQGTGPIWLCRLTYSKHDVRDYWVKIGDHEFGIVHGKHLFNRYYHPQFGMAARSRFSWKRISVPETEIQPPWRDGSNPFAPGGKLAHEIGL